MQVADTSEFIVKVPNNGDYSNLNVGDDLPIGWNMKDCHALDAPSAE